jgi:hypothetical protein
VIPLSANFSAKNWNNCPVDYPTKPGVNTNPCATRHKISIEAMNEKHWNTFITEVKSVASEFDWGGDAEPLRDAEFN